MSYKTILVHFNDVRRANRLAAASVEIARSFASHLVGLHVFPAYRLKPPVPLPIGGDVIGRIKAQIREETNQIATVFQDATVSQPFVAEWRSVTTEHREPVQVVLDHARAADLVIASQVDPDWDLRDILDFPERLAIEGGRPVLVVPNARAMVGIPRRVVVGWKPCREAARALFDALPLLKAADEVELLMFETGQQPPEGRLPNSAIEAALARHGVKVTTSNREASDASVGEELCLHAIEKHADLLVLGAYGHSRLRELAFGGVTRHVLREMTVPVLFSH
jgi:nucleotide-binding universal stress UspA family protein